MAQIKRMLCPKCEQKFVSSKENKEFLPFCSKICKMVDLAKWLNEKYVVPGEHAPDIEPEKEE